MTTKDDRRVLHGRVKFFDPVAGYGYIVPDNADLPDVMLHRTALKESGFPLTIPSPKAPIEVEAVKTPRGWKAVRVLSFGSEP